MAREENIKIFEDTVQLYHTDKDLIDNIKRQNEGTQIILEGKSVEYILPKGEDLESMKVIVTQSSTFDAARKYDHGKTAVLNFASATTPGGGVTKGSTAQEECLCRCSTLYATLSNKKCWDEFYKPHRNKLNALHNNDIIWTPNVAVFKDDHYNLLDWREWKRISVITCAAPNLREKNVDMFNVDKALNREVSNDELFKIHYNRAMKIFAVAAKNKVDNFVVGAFGCGAFRNDPETVAKAWKKATEDFNFPGMTIEFAIYDGPYSNNFEVFKKVFELS